MLAVVAVAYDGLCTFEFGCAVEVFGLARPEFPVWYSFCVAAVEPGPLRATGGVGLLAEAGLERLDTAGTIIIPGWRGIDADAPASLIRALQRAHRDGARLVALCSGAVVLAQAGLLDGGRAAIHWRYVDAFARRFPAVRLAPDVLYVDGGRVLTSAGSAAALDLCLHLVRQDFGVVRANAVARRLVVPPQRDGEQAQYVAAPVPPARGMRLAPLLDQVRAALDQAWPIERLAREAGTSPRGLHRRFVEATGVSPGSWLMAERLARACSLLEQPDGALDDIAAACGFGGAAAMRHHFRVRLQTSPAAYRRARLRHTAQAGTASRQVAGTA